MEEKFRFGIMGAGNIAEEFCQSVEKTGIACVAAVAGRTPGKARRLAEKYGIAAAYQDYEEMLKQEKLDAVYIAATTNAHYPLTMLCLDYRMPVLCEKAMFRTSREAQEVFSRSRQLGVFVMEGMWSRFLPKMNQVRRWIADGRIGDLRFASVDIGFCAPASPDNRYFNRELGGGAMYDLTVYCYDILTAIIQKPVKKIEIQSVWTDTDVDAQEQILVQFEGCQARLSATFLANVDNRAVFYGDKGKILMEYPHFGRSCSLHAEGQEPEYFEDSEEKGFVYEIREVVDCVRQGKIESETAPHSMTMEASRLYDQILASRETAERIQGIVKEMAQEDE